MTGHRGFRGRFPGTDFRLTDTGEYWSVCTALCRSICRTEQDRDCCGTVGSMTVPAALLDEARPIGASLKPAYPPCRVPGRHWHAASVPVQDDSGAPKRPAGEDPGRLDRLIREQRLSLMSCMERRLPAISEIFGRLPGHGLRAGPAVNAVPKETAVHLAPWPGTGKENGCSEKY